MICLNYTSEDEKGKHLAAAKYHERSPGLFKL